MPLWRSTDQANSAPKFLGAVTNQKAYAGQANVTTTGTFTQGSNTITALGSVTGITLNQLISSSTVGANLSSGAIVTAIINSTAVGMSQTFAGTTASGASISFQYDGVRGYNLYGNTTPDAFINNQAVGLFNLLTIPKIQTITANTIAGNNWLTNPSAGFSNTQTGAVSQSNNIMIVTSTASIAPGQAVYSTAANTTGGSPVWSNAGTYAVVANVINSTAVLLTAVSPLTNAAASFYFSNIAPNMIASGAGLPSIASNCGTVSTVNTTITGTISNGTIGSNGNILNVTAFTGPTLQIGQELLANATLGIANGTYVVSTTAVNGIGNYVLSANSISNGASAAAVTMKTVMPAVLSVNATTIVLTSNAYAISNNTGNSVTFSSYEKTVYGHGLSAGWDLIKWGTGPVTSFTVNTTPTANYANGETIVISGGSANALGTITTNATGNATSVAVTYAGMGFTNTASATVNYSRQLHLANVTATGTPTGYTAGDLVTVTCTYNLASFTGVISGGILTASSVTGTIYIGNLIKGTGVAANTQVLAQLSGTAGGAGTYAVSTTAAAASTTMTSTGQIVAGVASLTSTAVANSNITLTNVGLFTSGLTTGNLVFTYSNSTGGTGGGSGITFSGSFATASSGSAVNLTLGGKSGRVYTETLVALTGTSPYVSENAADNNTFPNS